MQLVSRKREQIDAQFIYVESHLSTRLYRVCMKQSSIQLRQVSKFFDWLHRSDHVIGGHDRYEGNVLLQDAQQTASRDDSVAIDWEIRNLRSRTSQVSAGLKDCRVFNLRRDDMSGLSAGADGADQREVVGFCAAGGKNNFIRLRADQVRNLHACCLDCFSCSAAFLMQARRISEGPAKIRQHRLKHTRIDWRGGRMIKINSRTHDFLQLGCAGPCAP